MHSDEQHKRRPHYSGKYPRRFEEKYKELNPEKYAETVEHVIGKGMTPAGMHVPICVNEIIDILGIVPGMQGLDCTLGYGGHTLKFLEKLDHTGRQISLDIDPIESVKTEKRIRDLGYEEKDFSVERINFAEIDKVALKYGKFDYVLADLGVSSMQIDDPKRGFSFREDGPLDLRLDPTSGKSASERLKEMGTAEIEGMLSYNGDEVYAREIARAIDTANHKGGVRTTSELCEVIRKALWKIPKEDFEEEYKKALKRCFQAIRIDVNHEYEVLEQLLSKLPGVLNPGAGVCILTFHSGEDRIVKKIFQMHRQEGIYSGISEDVIRPSAEECYRNPRARSAKLRWAVKA